ncbi:hypothetical protein VULLAG_LOCUS690 [Vulpes lagopus]
MVLFGGAGGRVVVCQSSEKYFSLPPACCATLGMDCNKGIPRKGIPGGTKSVNKAGREAFWKRGRDGLETKRSQPLQVTDVVSFTKCSTRLFS